LPIRLEGDLIRTAQVEGGAALERVISLVWPEAYRISASILRDRGLAEDAAQDACVAIVRALPASHDPRAFYGWSYRVIVNAAMSVARRRRTVEPLEALDDRRVLFDSDDSLDLADALSALPIAQRCAIVLHYYAGFTSREIAESTGLPRSTIRFHLMLARGRLRKALSSDRNHLRPTQKQEVYHDVL
jgi:RNA polymerase sigma-70 factor (ECF subfamily)